MRITGQPATARVNARHRTSHYTYDSMGSRGDDAARDDDRPSDVDVLRQENDALRAALETRTVIAYAVGMFMVTGNCTAEVAMDRLKAASQRTNVPVRELAADVVRKHERAIGKAQG